jgi:putative protease
VVKPPQTELLAPAGGPEAAFAALHYGADAIYLGLQRFSARAEADNFSPDPLGEVLTYAHSLRPRRAVYVALNTLIADAEVDDAIESLALIESLGVDAVIVQDLGVARLVRRHFPGLALHASTQLAIHNVAGAVAARELGFRRVTLARELTLDDIRAVVAAGGGLEVEVFVHGALCYAYSGLCLYSSMLRGRSGNRGRCAYPCREAFDTDAGGAGFPFSMKDLALKESVADLKRAGVFSFKIEGRKKSPLYVAATTHYYRQLLDGKGTPPERRMMEEDIKTIFSRPWTPLYVKSARNRDVTDVEVVGHRGAPIGRVEDVVRRGRVTWIRFATRRRLEVHDGLQVDIPGEGRPFGFAVEKLVLAGRREDRPGTEVFEAPAAALVEVALPPEHPKVPEDTPIYCSSSQAVKQRYRFPIPKPGLFRARQAVRIRLDVEPGRLVARARLASADLEVEVDQEGVFEPSREPRQVEAVARAAFEKLGETAFEQVAFTLHNPRGLFVPVSLLNRIRRDLTGRLEERRASMAASAVATIVEAERREEPAPREPAEGGARWSVKVDMPPYLAAFEGGDWDGVEDVVVSIARGDAEWLDEALRRLAASCGRDRIRLALPALTRERDAAYLAHKIKALRGAGWDRWEAANLSAWTLLRQAGAGGDRTGDWSLYATNRSAIRQGLEMGLGRVTLSPEDGLENLESLVAQYGDRATVIVYQHTPLFVSENCALAAMARACPAGPDCRDAVQEWVSAKGERIWVVQQDCRTIVLSREPFCLSRRLKRLVRAGARHLRADFIWQRYTAEQVRDTWRALRRGEPVPGIEANVGRRQEQD